MSQSDFAEKIDLHPSYLSRIEQGERRPSPRILKLMSAELGVSLKELLTAVGLIDEDTLEAPPTAASASVMQEIELLKRQLAQIAGPAVGKAIPRRGDLDVRTIPVFDQVPAGVALPEAQGTYKAMPELTLTESELRHDAQAFALVVTGDSMRDLGILDGDIVVVSPSSRIDDGDTVVAILGDRDISLKVAYFEGRKVLLHAGNPNYRPILLKPPEEVEILGKVILVRRNLP